MKKIFISILVLISALTIQAQNVLTPEQQLEKAQKELEEAKRHWKQPRLRQKLPR